MIKLTENAGHEGCVYINKTDLALPESETIFGTSSSHWNRPSMVLTWISLKSMRMVLGFASPGTYYPVCTWLCSSASGQMWVCPDWATLLQGQRTSFPFTVQFASKDVPTKTSFQVSVRARDAFVYKHFVQVLNYHRNVANTNILGNPST